MYDNWNYNHHRQKELLRKAEQMRLAEEVMRSRKSLVKRFLASLGGWMVATGQRLHKRYAPARVPTYVTTPMPSLNRDMAAWYVGKAHCDREPSEATPGKAQVAPRALWRRSR
jgi:hypothetical protein